MLSDLKKNVKILYCTNKVLKCLTWFYHLINWNDNKIKEIYSFLMINLYIGNSLSHISNCDFRYGKKIFNHIHQAKKLRVTNFFVIVIFVLKSIQKLDLPVKSMDFKWRICRYAWFIAYSSFYFVVCSKICSCSKLSCLKGSFIHAIVFMKFEPCEFR